MTASHPTLTQVRAPRGSPAPSLPRRTRFAVGCGALTSWLSRVAGIGRGGIIGGRVALALDPDALRRLAAGRTVVLVTGTNGKTTTTLMLSRALSAASADGSLGENTVATNSFGANMPDGLVAALAQSRQATVAVLEIDESYLPEVTDAVRPAAVVLLNLSRDQLDRVGEVSQLEKAIRDALAVIPETAVIANADDVLVASAAADCACVVWVAAGGLWTSDTVSCPRCGGPVARGEGYWSCQCGHSRPEPAWLLHGDDLRRGAAQSVSLQLRLPGRANQANAAMAIAAADRLGVPMETALAAVRGLRQVDGRYERVVRGEHVVRILLAKNPAGWQETLALVEQDAAMVICVNGRQADGEDMSWLWDVPFESLRGRFVVAAGERSADLDVRLDYAGVDHDVIPDPLHALDRCPAGQVDLTANYTAFRALRAWTRRAG